MARYELEEPWTKRFENIGRVEINYIPFQIVLNKYKLDKKLVGTLAHEEYRRYDDSPFCIDIIDVNLLNRHNEEDGRFFVDGDDRWLTNLGIDATDIPSFVKKYNNLFG